MIRRQSLKKGGEAVFAERTGRQLIVLSSLAFHFSPRTCASANSTIIERPDFIECRVQKFCNCLLLATSQLVTDRRCWLTCFCYFMILSMLTSVILPPVWAVNGRQLYAQSRFRNKEKRRTSNTHNFSKRDTSSGKTSNERNTRIGFHHNYKSNSSAKNSIIDNKEKTKDVMLMSPVKDLSDEVSKWKVFRTKPIHVQSKNWHNKTKFVMNEEQFLHNFLSPIIVELLQTTANNGSFISNWRNFLLCLRCLRHKERLFRYSCCSAYICRLGSFSAKLKSMFDLCHRVRERVHPKRLKRAASPYFQSFLSIPRSSSKRLAFFTSPTDAQQKLSTPMTKKSAISSLAVTLRGSHIITSVTTPSTLSTSYNNDSFKVFTNFNQHKVPFDSCTSHLRQYRAGANQQQKQYRQRLKMLPTDNLGVPSIPLSFLSSLFLPFDDRLKPSRRSTKYTNSQLYRKANFSQIMLKQSLIKGKWQCKNANKQNIDLPGFCLNRSICHCDTCFQLDHHNNNSIDVERDNPLNYKKNSSTLKLPISTSSFLVSSCKRLTLSEWLTCQVCSCKLPRQRLRALSSTALPFCNHLLMQHLLPCSHLTQQDLIPSFKHSANLHQDDVYDCQMFVADDVNDGVHSLRTDHYKDINQKANRPDNRTNRTDDCLCTKDSCVLQIKLLLDLDAKAESQYNLFKGLISHYDCRLEYSVNWHCQECKVSFQRLLLSLLH